VEEARARELLAAERRRIETELRSLRSGLDSGELSAVDQHPADSGTELFERERDRSIIESLEADLAAIGRAEDRLDGGTFGLSVASGDPIPDERLEAIPHAELTADEQARVERA
jgi:RNA polymerase-binding transcription factor DksA